MNARPRALGLKFWLSTGFFLVAIVVGSVMAGAILVKAGYDIDPLERIGMAIAAVASFLAAFARWMSLRLVRTRSGVVSLISTLLMCGALIVGYAKGIGNTFFLAFAGATLVNWYAMLMEREERRIKEGDKTLADSKNGSTAHN
jgi:uncharacterized membrane protein YhaH (DUF805 family)